MFAAPAEVPPMELEEDPRQTPFIKLPSGRVPPASVPITFPSTTVPWVSPKAATPLPRLAAMTFF